MGMDVYGTNPSSECGRYFRASIWSWSPLLRAMKTTCSDLLGEELLTAMSYNDGAGPDEQEMCTKIADRLEGLLANGKQEFVVESDLRVDKSGKFVSPTDAAELDPAETMSPYAIDAEQVAEWTRFLRHCGGFSVY